MPFFVCDHWNKEKPLKVELPGEPILIGRSRGAGVCLRDTSVSKKHVQVERRGTKYRFRDLGSRNGTYLNEFKIQEGTLDHGDRLRLGKIVLEFREHAESEAAAVGSEEPPRIHATKRPPSRRTRERTGPQGSGPRGSRASTARTGSAEPTVTGTPMSGRVSGDQRPGPRSGNAHVSGAPRSGVSMAPWVVACIGCFLVGLFLGRISAPTGRMDESTADRDEGTAAAPTLEPEPDSVLTVEAPIDSEPPEMFGPQADLDDPEISARTLYRLALDMLGRTPTRSEYSSLVSKRHEDRWRELASRADGLGLRTTADVASRFLGRELTSEETELADERQDVERLAIDLTSSETYSSEEHRRPRTLRQQARALWVDVVDREPTVKDEETLTRALEARGEEAIRKMALFRDAAIGPDDLGLTPSEWIQETYLRFLLRSPTPDELSRALTEIERDGGNWRSIIVDLALRADYSRY